VRGVEKKEGTTEGGGDNENSKNHLGENAIAAPLVEKELMGVRN